MTDARSALVRPMTKRKAPAEIGRDQLKDLKPATVYRILSDAAGGQEERWFDFADKMADQDEHLAGLMGTRVNAVVALDLIIEPANDTPAAKVSAGLCKRAIDDEPNVEVILADLLSGGIFNGRGVYEHVWRQKGMYYYSRPEWVDPRHIRYDSEWEYQVRNLNDEWVGLPDGKYMIHSAKERPTIPTKGALLRAVSWLWLWKFWAWTFWVNGAERVNNPLLYTKVPRGSNDDIKTTALEAIEKLSADHAAVFEDSDVIESLDANFTASSEVWDKLITRCNEGMTKLILGSTTNVEIGDTGGAYAAAQSQGAVTIEPRIERDAKGLCRTVKAQWLGPHLDMNAHLIQGDPVLPIVRLSGQDQHEDIPIHVFEALERRGLLSGNQILTMAGLPPIEGGDALVGPAEPAPAFSQPGGAQPPVPFSRRTPRPKSQQRLPWTSPTSSASLSPIGTVPPPKSGDPSS